MQKKFRTVLSLILVLTMISGMGIFSYAGTPKEFKLSETVSAVLDSDGKLTVTGTGKMPGYSSGGETPFGYSNSIKSVEISEGITTLGNYTFYKCGKITSVSLPSTLTEIGFDAFNSCSELVTVDIPQNSALRKIDSDAFCYCKKLENISFPATVEEIGNLAFLYDNSDSTGKAMPFMKKLPDGPVYIGKVLYTYKGEIPAPYSFTAKDGTRSIGIRAFEGHSELTTVNLPSSVKIIEQFAFLDCTSLSSVNIPEDTESLGYRVFEGCTALEKVRIPEKTYCETLFNTSGIRTIEGWQSSFAHQFVYDYNENLDADAPDRITFVNIGEHTHSLVKVPAKEVTSASEGSYEYYKCTACGRIYEDAEGACTASCTDKIISVASEGKIGQDVRYKLYEDKTLFVYGKGGTYDYYHDKGGNNDISDLSPFTEKAEIKKIIVEEGITYLGNDLFSKASTVEEVILPDSLIEIGDRTFRNSNAKTIKLGNKLEIIGTEAFAYSEADFNFPASLKIMKDNALKGSAFQDNIKNNGRGEPYYFGTVLFSNNPWNRGADRLRADATCIYNEAFSKCGNFTVDELFNEIGYNNSELELGKNLIYIGGRALDKMQGNLREYYGKVLYKAKDFDSYADENLQWRIYKVRPGTYSIAPYAFEGAIHITKIDNLPDSVVLINENAFTGSGLDSIYGDLSPKVTVIGANAFYKTEITAAPFSVNVEKVEAMAYAGCGFGEMSLPDSVKEVSAMAFQDNTGSVNLSKNLVRVGSRAFYKSSLGKLSGELPANLEYAGNDAFPNFKLRADENGLCYVGKVLYDCDPAKVSENIVIKEGTTQIAGKALMGASKIKSITIPESVTYIGDYAFSGCTGLSALELPTKLTHLGKNILEGNKTVSEITINSNVLSINYSYGDYGPISGSAIKTIYATDEYSSPGGYYAYICDVKHIRTDEADHFLVPVKGTPATCTSEGIKDHYKCRICDRLFSENNEETETDIKGLALSLAPHTRGTAVKENVKAPTCGANGSYDEVYYCTVCGQEDGRTKVTVPATGNHTKGDEKKENVVSPTATEAGSYDSVYYCTVCGQEISRTKVSVPSKGYVPGDVSGDGLVRSGDARTALRLAAGFDDGLTELQKKIADVNGDGKVLSGDARLILRAAVGLEKLL